ncbi:hypothetical protein B0H16DRAFT_1480739 [Mycena metata]|uniref:Uncharacterized protein n=1 Tax=Mycena metata TaxID=1033252 RepID=A0AAD7MC23_9AGAR|nr:hypothetical protein B0H16DRAFT_1480739 [Mycena metata]
MPERSRAMNRRVIRCRRSAILGTPQLSKGDRLTSLWLREGECPKPSPRRSLGGGARGQDSRDRRHKSIADSCPREIDRRGVDPNRIGKIGTIGINPSRIGAIAITSREETRGVSKAGENNSAYRGVGLSPEHPALYKIALGSWRAVSGNKDDVQRKKEGGEGDKRTTIRIQKMRMARVLFTADSGAHCYGCPNVIHVDPILSKPSKSARSLIRIILPVLGGLEIGGEEMNGVQRRRPRGIVEEVANSRGEEMRARRVKESQGRGWCLAAPWLARTSSTVRNFQKRGKVPVLKRYLPRSFWSLTLHPRSSRTSTTKSHLPLSCFKERERVISMMAEIPPDSLRWRGLQRFDVADRCGSSIRQFLRTLASFSPTPLWKLWLKYGHQHRQAPSTICADSFHAGMETNSGVTEEVCPRCKEAFLTVPMCSTGYFTPENEGRYYQKCMRNDFTPNAGCRYFYFNDTVQRAFEGLPDAQDWSSLLASAPAASSFGSPARTRRPLQECGNPTCKSARHSQCVQLFCKNCCRLSPRSCSAPGHKFSQMAPLNSFTVGPPTPGPSTPRASSLSSSPNSVPPSRAYARPVDPSYAAKITTDDFPVHTPSNQIAAYKKATTHTLEVQWWIKDDVAAEVFLVAAPNFPFFHPRDAPVIVDFLGGEAAAQNYAYWSPDKRWMRTNLPITIKVNTPLFLRSPNVTVCLDGPTSTPVKRKLSLTTDDITPATQRARFQNISPIEPLVFALGTATSPQGSSRVTTPPDSDVIDLSQDDETSVPSLKEEILDVFTKKSAGTVPLKFKDGFDNRTFVSATYYENVGKWRSLSREAQKEAVAKGRTPEGEWLYIFRNYQGAKADRNLPHLHTHILSPNRHRISYYFWTMSYILNSAYFVLQMQENKKLTLDHVKKIIRTHRGVTSLRNTKTFPAVARLLDADQITVDWAFVLGHDADNTRSVETLLRQYVEEGLITAPKLHHDRRGSLSSLSSVSSTESTTPPERPFSAMSGVQEHHGDIHMTVPVIPGDTVNPQVIGQPGAANPANPAIGANPVTNTGAVSTANPSILMPDGAGNSNAAVPPPVQEAISYASTTSWRGTYQEYTAELVWHLVAFDPICDVREKHVKVLTLNLGVSDEHEVVLFRHNKLELRLIEDRPYPINSTGLLVTCHPIPDSARTFAVNARKAVTQSLMTRESHFPGNKTFSVYWCLPGFHFLEEFGPLMIYHAQEDIAQWTVPRDHLLPVLGPPEALRLLLVVRPYNDHDHSLTHKDHVMMRRRIGQQPLLEADSDSGEEDESNPPAYTHRAYKFTSRPIPAAAPAIGPHRPHSAPGASVPPTVPSTEASGDEMDAANDNGEDGDDEGDDADDAENLDEDVAHEMKRLTAAWLLQEFGNSAIVHQIRSSDNKSKRARRKVTQLVEWVTEVHRVCTKYQCVPITPETGMAGDRLITRADFASLFRRQPQWIKQSLNAYTVIAGHQDNARVKAIVDGGRIFGMAKFEAELLKAIK